MYNGDRARKTSLVEYGFRLPCAFDNRPLKFDEFQERLNQVIYVSATPGSTSGAGRARSWSRSSAPRACWTPGWRCRPVEGQIDDLIGEINARTARQERVLVTTLTKKMAEDLTAYLTKAGIRVRYMHHDVETIERMELIRDLRLGEFDVLVGINLLREGLDMPEVSLVAILDADKEGFLRSETSLIQTIGRAARNAEGMVILYADTVTRSMKAAMDETERRREMQDAFNQAHGIVPKTVIKSVRDVIDLSQGKDEAPRTPKALSDQEREATIAYLEREMQEASHRLEFEYAAILRDRIIQLREKKPPALRPALAGSPAPSPLPKAKAWVWGHSLAPKQVPWGPHGNAPHAPREKGAPLWKRRSPSPPPSRGRNPPAWPSCASSSPGPCGAAWGCLTGNLSALGIAPETVVMLRNLGACVILAVIFLIYDRSIFRIQLRHIPLFLCSGIISILFFTPVLLPQPAGVLPGGGGHPPLHRPPPSW